MLPVIDMQVLVDAAWTFMRWPMTGRALRLARKTNDTAAAAVEAYPGPLCRVRDAPHVAARSAADELERTVKEFGFKGAMIRGTLADASSTTSTSGPSSSARKKLEWSPIYLTVHSPQR